MSLVAVLSKLYVPSTMNTEQKVAQNSHLQIYGLRNQMKPFFHWNPEFLGLGRLNGPINSRAFGVFLAKLSAPILVHWVHCACFPLFNLSLYIHIQNIYLGLGFEFGPKRIRESLRVHSQGADKKLTDFWQTCLYINQSSTLKDYRNLDL